MKTLGEGRGWNNLTGKGPETSASKNSGKTNFGGIVPVRRKPEGKILRGKHPLVKSPRATFLVGKDRGGGSQLGPSNGEKPKAKVREQLSGYVDIFLGTDRT